MRDADGSRSPLSAGARRYGRTSRAPRSSSTASSPSTRSTCVQPPAPLLPCLPAPDKRGHLSQSKHHPGAAPRGAARARRVVTAAPRSGQVNTICNKGLVTQAISQVSASRSPRPAASREARLRPRRGGLFAELRRGGGLLRPRHRHRPPPRVALPPGGAAARRRRRDAGRGARAARGRPSHGFKGLLLYSLRRNFTAAEAAFRRSLELTPTDVSVHLRSLKLTPTDVSVHLRARKRPPRENWARHEDQGCPSPPPRAGLSGWRAAGAGAGQLRAPAAGRAVRLHRSGGALPPGPRARPPARCSLHAPPARDPALTALTRSTLHAICRASRARGRAGSLGAVQPRHAARGRVRRLRGRRQGPAPPRRLAPKMMVRRGARLGRLRAEE